MSRYAGKKGLVYVSDNMSSAASLVSQLSNWTFDFSTNKIDVTCFGDRNKNWLQGWPDAKGTFKGLWNDADSTLFQAMGSANGCYMYLYPSSDAITKYWYMPAWLDLNMAVDVNGVADINGTFSANGDVGHTF